MNWSDVFLIKVDSVLSGSDRTKVAVPYSLKQSDHVNILVAICRVLVRYPQFIFQVVILILVRAIYFVLSINLFIAALQWIITNNLDQILVSVLVTLLFALLFCHQPRRFIVSRLQEAKSSVLRLEYCHIFGIFHVFAVKIDTKEVQTKNFN